jgi:hypothetical protein
MSESEGMPLGQVAEHPEANVEKPQATHAAIEAYLHKAARERNTPKADTEQTADSDTEDRAQQLSPEVQEKLATMKSIVEELQKKPPTEEEGFDPTTGQSHHTRDASQRLRDAGLGDQADALDNSLKNMFQGRLYKIPLIGKLLAQLRRK